MNFVKKQVNLNKILTLIVIFSQIANVLGCDSDQGQTRSYGIDEWSQEWQFRGFDVKTDHYYYLLNYETDSECAVIKESKDGTQAWAKRYTADQCQSLVVDQTETSAYFANKKNSNYAGIAKISCSDGSLTNYYTSTDFTINGDTLQMKLSNTGNTLYFAGSFFGSGENNICIWDTTTMDFG